MTLTRPNILLIVTDEERQQIPRPAGFPLPIRGWERSRPCSAPRTLSPAQAGSYKHMVAVEFPGPAAATGRPANGNSASGHRGAAQEPILEVARWSTT